MDTVPSFKDTTNIPEGSDELEILREGLANIRGNPNEYSEELHVQALDLVKLARKHGESVSVGFLHANIMRILSQLNRQGEAIAYGMDTLEELRALKDKQPLMAGLNAMSVASNNKGDYPGAMEYANEALQIARHLNRPDAIGHIASNIGLDFTYLGEYEQALEYFKESLDAWEKTSNNDGKANAYLNQGLVYKHFQDFRAARNAYQEALKLYHNSGDIRGLSAAYRNLSECSYLEGKFEEARELVLVALENARNSQSELREAHCLAHKGSIEIALGQVSSAREDLETALKVYEELKIPRGFIGVWISLAGLPDTDPDQSFEYLQAALKEAEKYHLKPEQVSAHRELSLKYKNAQQYQLAYEHLEKSSELEKTILSENAERRARSLQVMHEVVQERAVAELERLRNVELREALLAVEKQREIVIEESRQRTQFLSVSAHDLRNMTGGLLAGIEILRDSHCSENSGTNSENLELLDHMADSAEELHQTMMQLMDAGTIEARSFKLEKSEVDLAALVRSEISKWQTRARHKHQTLDLICCESCSSLIDLNRMRNVLSNVLSNAIKYSPENTKINVRLFKGTEFIVISVQDSGPGFTEGDLNLLGRPFQRLSAKPTGGEISVGLGLYIVRHLVEMHDGKIHVSNVPGGGAQFCIKLPL